MKRSWRVFRLAVGALVVFFFLGGAGMAARRFLVTSPIFTITRVHVAGGARTPARDFESIAQNIRGRNLFALDLDRFRREAERHPWVREAVLYRVAPNAVRIVLKEPVAAAVAERDGATFWLDEYGEFIAPTAADELAHGVAAPLLVGAEGENADEMRRSGAEVLIALKGARPDFYERLASLDVSLDDRFTARLKDYDGPLYLHRVEPLRNLENFLAIANHVAARHAVPQYVDLRWRNQIVVMPGAEEEKNAGGRRADFLTSAF